MRISDWSSDVCSSDLVGADCAGREDVLRPGETRIIPIGEHVALEAQIGVERTLDEELAVDALILAAVSDRHARRVRRIDSSVGIARHDDMSRPRSEERWAVNEGVSTSEVVWRPYH